MAENIDNYLHFLVGYYGFKNVHTRLLELMKNDYEFLHSHFQQPSVPATIPSVLPVAPVAPIAPVVQSPVAEKKKTRKPRAKKVAVAEQVNTLVPELTVAVESPEIKEVVLVPPNFRDPKEVKEYQKKAEESKRKENDAMGIQIHTILTKENLKQWVEEEGHTYAWVAREKAGCSDTQVAATAQMMGIKSKISKKRGMIMSGN